MKTTAGSKATETKAQKLARLNAKRAELVKAWKAEGSDWNSKLWFRICDLDAYLGHLENN